MLLAQQTVAAPVTHAETVLFFAFASLVVLSAWAIVLSSNIVRMALYLLLTLAGVAGFYFMLNAEFLAAVQLIVYAGGTLILIVFGVMLTSKNPALQLKPAGWERFVGILVGVLLAGMVFFALVNTTLRGAGVSLAATGGSVSERHDQVAVIGKALLSDYLVPFEVAGVLLLVVMIGAAFMARKRAGE